MGKIRWEYSGESIDMYEIRRAEKNEIKYDEEEKDDEAFDESNPLEGVPEDTDIELHLNEEQGKYFHSMSMSDIARDITKGIDVPTQRDVKNATEIDLEEIGEEGYDEFDKYMAEIE